MMLPAWDRLSASCNKISTKSKRVHESFLSQNIFCDFSVRMELENEKTKNVNENENKENKNINVFQEYILQQD